MLSDSSLRFLRGQISGQPGLARSGRSRRSLVIVHMHGSGIMTEPQKYLGTWETFGTSLVASTSNFLLRPLGVSS